MNTFRILKKNLKMKVPREQKSFEINIVDLQDLE